MHKSHETRMTEDEADEAHKVSELFQDMIVSVGVTLLKDLNQEQRDYVITKCHDEFRFWRVEDGLS